MKDLVENLAGHRIAVVGDVMLDRYLSGTVDRISPEAPVPVMLVGRESGAAGGAANVAANLASLGVTVRLVGLTGADPERDELIGHLLALGEVDCAGLIAVSDWRTSTKLRVIGAHQHLLRIDREEIRDFQRSVEDRLIAAARAATEASDVLIVSDYGKGVCSDRLLAEVIAHARVLGRTVIVDPKRTDLSAYRGASLLTPNRRELSLATGLPCESDEEAACAAAVAQAACGADVVLTRSEKGMSFLPRAGEPIHLPTVAQDVFDVSGAGDTVVSVLAAALAGTASMHEALRLANHAAGIVVSKVGTATVTRDELAASLVEPGVPDGEGGLLPLDDVVALRRRWEAEKLVVGFANGCFDLLHPGHVSLIRQAARACDRLIIGLNSDASVRRLKGSARPIQDQWARGEVIGALRGVSAVVIFDEDTPRACIAALQPDLLVKGADYAIADVVGADIVADRGGRVLLAALRDGFSTTRLVGGNR